MRARPRLLVFDWDGTLADSEARIVGCFRRTIADLGKDPLPDTELRGVIGLGLPQTADALFPGCTDGFRAAFVACYRRHWLAPDAPKPTLFDDAVPTLEHLGSRGYALAVATGKSRAGLDRELDETGLRRFMVATRAADETRSKPHPQMLWEILTETRIESSEAVVIGDSIWDLQMARAAEVDAIAVVRSESDRSHLTAHRPLTCIDQLAELVSILP